MSNDEIREEYEKNVQHLRLVVPPDDIYDFAEQTFMAALYFLRQYAQHVDIKKEMQENAPTGVYTHNLLTLLDMREKGISTQLHWEFLLDD